MFKRLEFDSFEVDHLKQFEHFETFEKGVLKLDPALHNLIRQVYQSFPQAA